MINSVKPPSSTADFIGIISAFVCLLHCLAGPILMGTAMHLHDHNSLLLLEEWNYLFLAIGFFAVWWSSKHTAHKGIKYFMWATFGLLAAAVLFESIAEPLHYLVYVSSLGLIVAHVVNLVKR